MLNLLLIILQSMPPLCDYKVWIDTETGEKVKHHLRNMVQLNIMAEEIHARRMEERRHVTYFAMQREMHREKYKEKKEKERARKHEKT
jgi:hypothetical protein